jgi:hypothetical protein
VETESASPLFEELASEDVAVTLAFNNTTLRLERYRDRLRMLKVLHQSTLR